jgi:hypothetical protein
MEISSFENPVSSDPSPLYLLHSEKFGLALNENPFENIPSIINFLNSTIQSFLQLQLNNIMKIIFS